MASQTIGLFHRRLIHVCDESHRVTLTPDLGFSAVKWPQLWKCTAQVNHTMFVQPDSNQLKTNWGGGVGGVGNTLFTSKCSLDVFSIQLNK